MPIKVNPWDVGVKPRITKQPRAWGNLYDCISKAHDGYGCGGSGDTAEQAYLQWQWVRALRHKQEQFVSVGEMPPGGFVVHSFNPPT